MRTVVCREYFELCTLYFVLCTLYFVLFTLRLFECFMFLALKSLAFDAPKKR